MARVNKNNNQINKTPKEKTTTVLTGVKEESEKGELFFKVVLMVMIAAILVVFIYFIVDTILKSDDKGFEPKFHANNYVTVTNVEQVKSGQSNETISHVGLRHALDNFDYVYILFIAEKDTSILSETILNYQKEVLGIVDELYDLKKDDENLLREVKIKDDNKEEYTYMALGDMAFFFVDISDQANASWSNVIEAGKDAASAKNVPVLLEVYRSEDLAWFGPWDAVDANPKTATKLTNVLNSLK
ncbi:hypothetical protein [Acholeplasma equifetale]|uniref:hypothetical protein n=1 Tax=Acholeplasma equifetale TaxID=264634 RepID=UPI000479C20A|nr:hypothetical protein [Acholeplasma equifetale]